MADNFKNCSTKSVKAANSAKGSRNLIRRRRKRKHSAKRKNNHNYKRKRSFIIRKKKLQLSMSTSSAWEVPVSLKGGQHEDDTAFWKARAISLEFENKMLHKHIKQIYMGMIPQNHQLVQNEDEDYFDLEDVELKENKAENKNKISKENVREEQDMEDEENSKPPEEQISKKREEELKMLYGSAWRTIIGMETAVQLNYDLTIERNKSKYWPVVPIKI